jgi:hypothetical protein
MTNVVPINVDTAIITDQGARIDTYGQALLLGVFSDLCQYRAAKRNGSEARHGAGRHR